MMRTRLQRHISRRPSHIVTRNSSLFQSNNLSMIVKIVLMRAFAKNYAIAHQHTPNSRIRRSQPNSLPRKLQRSSEIQLVLFAQSHRQ